MAGPFDSGYEDQIDRAKRAAVTGPDDLPTTFAENTRIAFKTFAREDVSDASYREGGIDQRLNEQLALLSELTGDDSYVNAWTPNFVRGDGFRSKKEELLAGAAADIERLRQENPDAGLMTLEELRQAVKDEAKALRDERDRIGSQATTGGKLGQFAGTLGAAMTDPINIGSMFFGGSMATIPKAALTGAGVNVAAELAIQPYVFDYKQEIESPYGLKDAALNVGMAALGGAVLGPMPLVAEKGARGMSQLYRRTAEALGKAPGASATEKAAGEVLRDAADVMDAAPPQMDIEAHLQATAQARLDVQAGRTAEVGEITGIGDLRPEQIDPQVLEIDAERFQFKAGADAAGVTERLQGVEQWDPRLAGNVIVYEDAAGKQFIVDGHQRLALARRAIQAGQPTDEVRMYGFVLREADGVSVSDARRIAAVKNIAEGTGTAVDAAKILREGTLEDLPPLPPRSALVRDSQGLARLGDEAFMSVVNDVVDARYAAIVGRELEDAAEQLAALRVLGQAEPANMTQAEAIVQQVKAAGFERQVTADLFGEQEVAESLFKERARVLDYGLRKLRQDRQTFRTLVDREGEIQGAGNVLDAEANAMRLDTDEAALQTLSRLANSRGPVSEALSDAARRLKDGQPIGKVSDDFLDSVRNAMDQPAEARAPLDEVGPDPDAPNFGMPDTPRTLPDGHKLLRETDQINTKARQKMRDGWVQDILKDGTPVEGRKPVAFVMGGGGASGKGSVLKQLRKNGFIPGKGRIVHIDPDDIKGRIPEYEQIIKAGDGRAAAVVHEESSMIAKRAQAEAMDQRMDVVLDVTLGDKAKGIEKLQALKDAGYEVRLFGVTVDPDEAVVRAVKRAQRENRYVPTDHLLKAHKGFTEGWEEYVKLADGAKLFDNNTEARVIAAGQGGKLDLLDEARYTRFAAKENIDAEAKTLRDLRQSAPGQMAAPGSVRPRGMGRDAPRTAAGGAGQRPADPGRVPGQGLADASQHPALADDPILNDLLQAEADDLQRILAENPDLEIPTDIRMTPDGDVEVVRRPAREVFQELDQEESAIQNLITCMTGGVANG